MKNEGINGAAKQDGDECSGITCRHASYVWVHTVVLIPAVITETTHS